MVLRSCQELKLQGASTNGTYFLDSDGILIGEKPVEAHCDIDNGITEMGDEVEDTLEVCQGSGCAKVEIPQDQEKLNQMRALISISDECFQEIEFDCFSSPLQVNQVNVGTWLDYKGEHSY